MPSESGSYSRIRIVILHHACLALAKSLICRASKHTHTHMPKCPSGLRQLYKLRFDNQSLVSRCLPAACAGTLVRIQATLRQTASSSCSFAGICKHCRSRSKSTPYPPPISFSVAQALNSYHEQDIGKPRAPLSFLWITTSYERCCSLEMGCVLVRAVVDT